MIIGASPLAGQYYQISALATPVIADAVINHSERNPRDTRPPLPRGARYFRAERGVWVEHLRRSFPSLWREWVDDEYLTMRQLPPY